MKIRQETGKVVELESLAANTFRLTLEFDSRELPLSCHLGQFVRLQALAPGSILPRPFAVYHAEKRELQVVIRVAGQNTGLYLQLQPDDRIIVSGPHGRPIEINPEMKRVWLVGGGIGLAALFPLAVLLKEKASIIAGFKTADEVFGQEDFSYPGNWFSIATDDGITGYKGTAADLFALQLAACNAVYPAAVYTCGPVVMMKAVAKICQERQIPCFAFLERVMACGCGACNGCNVFMTGGRVLYVCKDGPVFPAEEIDWNALDRS